MRFVNFRIRNFKGINDCTISLEGSHSNVFSLIGLNESGKTTVLEAINYFVASDTDIQNLYRGDTPSAPITRLVPKSKKLNFNDSISISATLTLDDQDVAELTGAFRANGYELDTATVKRRINITQLFEFESSNFKRSRRTFDIIMKARKSKGSVYKEVGSQHDLWNLYTNLIKSMMPQICYFPTFLFDLPDRIYLEKFENEKPVNAYYRQLIQDVLDSLDDGLTLQTHVLDRIRHADDEWSWVKFFAGDRREQVSHLFLKVSSKISRVIIDSWKRIFQKDLADKRIAIEYLHDEDLDSVYIKIFVVDDDQSYEISERSLGFRWFFCFWLFTYFRTLRRGNRGVVFLLDEPASNLHARAQEELLRNLGILAGENNVVMYSTHSHYLINPHWLDGAFIVSNTGVNVDSLGDEFSSRSGTDIRVERYKAFVGSHPNQRTYFLPVLDALEYRPSYLTFERPTLLVEGRCDFAFLKLSWLESPPGFSVIPGNGAKSLHPLIGLLTGWGIPFTILLDDDKEGRDAKTSYRDRWGIGDLQIKTIGDFDPAFKGKSLESVLALDMGSEIKAHYNADELGKALVQTFMYESLAAEAKPMIPARLVGLSTNVAKWSAEQLLKPT